MMVDNCDADDTVEVGVEHVGVRESVSFGAHKISLHAGSVPSPTKMS